ncbi:MAG: LuxR C-terminal-related transcriptional regulator [Mycobacterium sp.]
MPVHLAPVATVPRPQHRSAEPLGWLKSAHAAEMIELLHEMNGHLDEAHDIGSVLNQNPSRSALAGLLAVVSEDLCAVVEGPAGTSMTAEQIRRTYQLILKSERLRSRRQTAELETHIQRLTAVQSQADSIPTDVEAHDLLRRTSADVARICGLERTMILYRTADCLRLESTYVQGDDELANEYQQKAGSLALDLAPHRIETHIVRSRRSALVTDPIDDPNAFQPIVSMLRTTGYVVAPVVALGEVVATIHGDHGFSGYPLIEADRDLLSRFAEIFGLTLERSILRGQLNNIRRSLRFALDESDEMLDSLGGRADFRASSEARTARRSTPGFTAESHEPVAPPQRKADGFARLTPRERSVLNLLATGASNADIARRLVITEGTVKTHVKKVLRKTGATNRSHAAAMYLQQMRQ